MYSHVHRAHHFLKKFGDLHVIVTCFNPMRFVARYTLTKEFITHAESAGAKVTVAELGFGERPFEVVEDPGPGRLQYRGTHELWVKESMINAAVTQLPPDWKYVAWIDGDVAFVNPHWVQETIQQLQHFPIVQMFNMAHDLDPSNRIIGSFKGFPASVLEDHWKPSVDRFLPGRYYHVSSKAPGIPGLFHPGFAWAATREAWNLMGGLLDFNIVGGGDMQMAFALYGRVGPAVFDGASQSYRNMVLAWQDRALALKQKVGYVPGTLLHYWHGKKLTRQYFDRWRILANNEFDPISDLSRDWQGIYQLTGNKIKLRDDLMLYFRQRQDDSINMFRD